MMQILRVLDALCLVNSKHRHFKLQKPNSPILPIKFFTLCFALTSLFCVCLAHARQFPNLEAAKGVASISADSITPLHIGDTIPETLWNLPLQMVKAGQKETTTVKLNDYRGKLIILDFWATWCTPCVKNLPKMYSLQKQYSNDLNIVLVNSKSTRDSSGTVSHFLENRKQAYEFQSIVMDTILKKFFPHNSIPHYVWLSDNKVVAITDEVRIDKDRLNEKLTETHSEVDPPPAIPYDFRVALFVNGNGGKPPKFLHQSFLTPYIRGLKTTTNLHQTDDYTISRITFTNNSVINLYRFAYKKIANATFARLIIDVADSSSLSLPEIISEEWKTKNLYNYEAQFPACDDIKARQIVKNDLKKFFGYKVLKNHKSMKCWVLKTLDSKKPTDFDKSLKRETNLYEEAGIPIFYNNYPFPPLLLELERIYNIPFIDETGLIEPVKLRLPADLLDSSELQKSLLNQGLSMTQETRNVQVVTISDK